MATVTNKNHNVGSLSEANLKVHDPLRRLRGYIRGYVIGQALTVLLICLAVCFWVGLALDYFSFKYLATDWTRDLPRWLRAVLLGGGLLFTCFFVELRRMLKGRGTLPAQVLPVTIQKKYSPTTERNLVNVRAGILVSVFGFLVYLLSWMLIAVAFLKVIDPTTASSIIKTAQVLILISLVVSLVGKLLCLTSPDPAGGRVFILATVVLDALIIASIVVNYFVNLPDAVGYAVYGASVLSFISFVLYLRETALFVGKSTLAIIAFVVLGLGILALALPILIVTGNFPAFLVGEYLVYVTLGLEIVFALSYLGLMCALSIQGRSLLMAALLAPLVLLYFGAWVGVALWRDSGSLGATEVGFLVAALVLAFTILVVVKRMLYDFSDTDLALVLERRFPKILGDRLITAVELSNPREAAKLGYSSAMVEQTIIEAADRVDQLNLREVFDWRRLFLQAGFALLLTAGVFAATVGGMMIVANAEGREVGIEQVRELDDNAVIWAQRNLLLDNERWPTRCLLVLLDFPANGELKKGKSAESTKEETSVTLRALAIEYAFRDSNAPECWRALTLKDIKTGKIPVSITVDVDAFPVDWKPRDEKMGFTIDEIKMNMQMIADGEQTLSVPGLGVKQAIETLLADVQKASQDPSLSRTLRKLSIPKGVVLKYRNESGSSKGDATMKGPERNEYTVSLDIRESIRFFLQAEDYQSESRRITLVPPPRVATLKSIERRPAYLYHHWQNDTEKQLISQSKQLGEPITVNVAGELKPKVRFPAGTDVTLEGETDKDLADDGVRIDDRGAKALKGIRINQTGKRSFTLTIPDVRTDLDFRLELKDSDGAFGVQELLLSPNEDVGPTINQFKPEVVRQVGESYKVTPMSLVPFSFFVQDDNGLGGMDFVYVIQEKPSKGEEQRRAARVAAGVGLMLSGPESPLTSYTYNLVLPITLQTSKEVIEGRIPVAYFKTQIEAMRQGSNWNQTRTQLNIPKNFDKLAQATGLRNFVFKDVAQLDSYLNDHEKRIEESAPFKGMDLTLIKWKDKKGEERELKANKDKHEVQRRYDMQVWLEASDNNVTRPDRRPRESTPHAFEIVSEIELVFDIYQEEQRLYDELARVAADLKRGTEELERVKFNLPVSAGADPINFDGYSVRVEEVQKIYTESKRVTDKVFKDYDKILRELRTNRIENLEYLDNVKNSIVTPLRQILNDDFLLDEGGKKVRCGFLGADVELKGLRQAVDNTRLNQQDRLEASRRKADFTEAEFRRLTSALNEILVQMRGVLTLKEILGNLNRIQLNSLESLRRTEEHRKWLEDLLFKGLK